MELNLNHITKRFPGVIALDGVSFEIASGECHAIVGENGAGKSTLGKIVAGIYRPDGGRVLIDGQPVAFRSPLDAAGAGVSIVHQELAFCPNLSIAENLYLGRLPARGGFMDRRTLDRGARGMLEGVGLAVDPWTPIGQLSTAQEQLVQIAAAIGRKARIVIMDEPTSSLSQAEAERLFEILGRLRKDGVTVLYVSHRLEEIFRLCDRITVLRDGRYIETLVTCGTTPGEVVRRMIGRSVADYFPDHLRAAPGRELLAVEGLSTEAAGDRTALRGVSFNVRAGEIVGLAGLVGAGRSEIARAVFGVDPSKGIVRLEGRALGIQNPRDAIHEGIGYLPEDRKRQGLVLSMECKENLSLSLLERLGRWLRGWFIDHGSERSLASDYFTRLRVRAPSIDAPIAGLSGGNQQKIALAKWLARDCQVLILDEPTRGVDVGAKAEIHALIDKLAGQGKGVLLISSELPEVLNLSTRILVVADGRIVGELPREKANQENLMRLMANVN